jgi:hypothetical protein
MMGDDDRDADLTMGVGGQAGVSLVTDDDTDESDNSESDESESGPDKPSD